MEEYTGGVPKEDFLKERYFNFISKAIMIQIPMHLIKKDGINYESLRAAYCLGMEASMMGCGAMVRGLVWEHSTSTMGMFFREHGGMMSCTARYLSCSIEFLLLISYKVYVSCCICITFYFRSYYTNSF